MPGIVEQSGAFRELSVEKTPVNSNDVVNKDYADAAGVNLGAVEEHIIAAIDNTYDLGSNAKKWKNIYAYVAFLSTMLVIGGIALYDDSVNKRLIINGSLFVNGSIDAQDNVTAQFYFGDGSLLTGLTGFNDTNNHWVTDKIYLYNDSTIIYYNETKLNSSIDKKLATTIFVPTNISLISGTYADGDLTSVQTAEDGDSFNITEAIGAAPLTVQFNFTDVSNLNKILLRLWYSGGLGHETLVGLYNYDSDQYDEIFGEITDMADFAYIEANVITDTNYVSADNEASIQLKHVQTGNSAHSMRIDYVSLIKGTSIQTITDHDGLSGRDDIENHPWALDAAATRNVTGNLSLEGSNQICFNGCSKASIQFNGTTLILKVN